MCSFVQEDLLKPLLNILMSSPAQANISKVPELEILSTLARHEKHRAGMTVEFLHNFERMYLLSFFIS